MDNLPDYLYRPDDYTIFYKVEIDGVFKYQHEHSFNNKYKSHGYEYETLIANDFNTLKK